MSTYLASHSIAPFTPPPRHILERFHPTDCIGAEALAGLQRGLELDQRTFLDEFGSVWREVGNLQRTRLKWYRFLQLGLFARIVVSEEIEGDYAEFGTWRGGSLYLVASEWRRLGQERRLQGFDSFEGLPAPDPYLDGSLLSAGMFDDLDLGEVQAFFDGKGMSEVELVQGWFEDTVQAVDDRSLALCHVDADCYESCKLALEHGYERLVPGGYLVLDDYRQPDCSGATIAAEEFFARRKEVIRMSPGIDCSGWVRKL